MEGLGERLSHLRQKNDLSKREIVQKLNITDEILENWENGNNRPTIKELREISNIYSINIKKIIPNRKLRANKLNAILKNAEGGHGILYLKNVQSQPFFPESIIKNVRIIEIKSGIMKIQVQAEKLTHHIVAVDDILGFREEMN